MGNCCRSLILLASLAGLKGAALSVALTPSIPAPAPVGTVVTWSAYASDATASIWYRFRGARAGSDLHVIRDYSPLSSLDWTASQREGLYRIEVSARNNSTGETAVESVNYQIDPVVTGDTPVISTTANPLVFLYSAPSCPASDSMRVEFQSADGVVQSTPYQSCQPPCPANTVFARTPLSVSSSPGALRSDADNEFLSRGTPPKPCLFRTACRPKLCAVPGNSDAVRADAHLNDA